jgi:hypothetical protein
MAEDPRHAALIERMDRLHRDLTEGEFIVDEDAAVARAEQLYAEACRIDREWKALLKREREQ